MRQKDDIYEMPEELDLSKTVRSPYPKLLKQKVTINLSIEVIEYFKKQSSETSIPYQSLINLYLLSCVNKKKKTWFVLEVKLKGAPVRMNPSKRASAPLVINVIFVNTTH